MGFFTDEERIKKFDLLRLIYLLAFLLSFGITEFGRKIYRPYIYSHNMNDFGLADSIGNLGGILVQTFIGMTLLNPSRKQGLRLILLFIVGYIVYEILQPFLPRGTFDWMDIYGTLLGGGFGTLIFLGLHWLRNRLPAK
jgi:hypothetical protein